MMWRYEPGNDGRNFLIALDRGNAVAMPCDSLSCSHVITARVWLDSRDWRLDTRISLYNSPHDRVFVAHDFKGRALLEILTKYCYESEYNGILFAIIEIPIDQLPCFFVSRIYLSGRFADRWIQGSSEVFAFYGGFLHFHTSFTIVRLAIQQVLVEPLGGSSVGDKFKLTFELSPNSLIQEISSEIIALQGFGYLGDSRVFRNYDNVIRIESIVGIDGYSGWPEMFQGPPDTFSQSDLRLMPANLQFVTDQNQLRDRSQQIRYYLEGDYHCHDNHFRIRENPMPLENNHLIRRHIEAVNYILSIRFPSTPARTLNPFLKKATYPENEIQCQGCLNYHGKTYGGKRFVCGLHPYGCNESVICQDFTSQGNGVQ